MSKSYRPPIFSGWEEWKSNKVPPAPYFLLAQENNRGPGVIPKGHSPEPPPGIRPTKPSRFENIPSPTGPLFFSGSEEWEIFQVLPAPYFFRP